MFAKLKQKIAEEESIPGEAPRSSSVSQAARARRARRVNGWSENKWERRRLSNASSLNESRDSVFSERGGYSSGFNVSRNGSFTARASSSLAATPVEPLNGAVRQPYHRASWFFNVDQIVSLWLWLLFCGFIAGLRGIPDGSAQEGYLSSYLRGKRGLKSAVENGGII